MLTFYSQHSIIRTLNEILSMNLVNQIFIQSYSVLFKKKNPKFGLITFLFAFRHVPVIGGWGNEVSIRNRLFFASNGLKNLYKFGINTR